MTPASAIVISGFPIVRTATAPAFTVRLVARVVEAGGALADRHYLLGPCPLLAFPDEQPSRPELEAAERSEPDLERALDAPDLVRAPVPLNQTHGLSIGLELVHRRLTALAVGRCRRSSRARPSRSPARLPRRTPAPSSSGTARPGTSSTASGRPGAGDREHHEGHDGARRARPRRSGRDRHGSAGPRTTIGESSLGLRAGEPLTVRELLTAMLVVQRERRRLRARCTRRRRGLSRFVALMNRKARRARPRRHALCPARRARRARSLLVGT